MPPQPIVSNTSPIINLSGVGLLNLLYDLYGQVVIPDAVATEFHSKARPKDPHLSSIPWLAIRPVVADPSLTILKNLGLGEMMAIALAQSNNARLLIIDDRLGRKIAQERHIRIIGTMGVLLQAKQVGLLPSIRPIIDEMISQGRYISPALRLKILSIAGEL